MLTNLEPAAPPLPLWSWKKILLCFLSVLTVGIIALLAYDEELEPFDDLMPTRTSEPDSKTNGYLFLKEKWEKLPKPSSEEKEKIMGMLDGTEAWDAPWVDSQRSGCASLANDLRTALLSPDFSSPVFTTPPDFAANSISWVVPPFRLLQLEMEARRRAGDWAAALALRKDLHQLVRSCFEGGNSLLVLLVGVSLNAVLCDDTCRLMELGKPDAEQSADLGELWLKDLPVIPAWEETIKRETTLSRNYVELVSKNEELVQGQRASFLERLFLKPNLTLNRLHRQHRMLLKLAFRTGTSAPASPFQGNRGTSGWRRFLDANYFGKQLTESRQAIWQILPGVTDSAFFRPRAVRARIAIYRWQLQHPGKWPATLEELVPEFLPAVPADPWNGQPLSWDPVSKTITAVGTDWSPGPALFDPAKRAWFSSDRENPGLRLELPPAPPPAPPKVKRKPRPKPAPGTPSAAPSAN